ncbi:MAG: lytic transglycosylase domain-containing protein [Pseudomonadota bacterium]
MNLVIAFCMHIATNAYGLPPQALPSLLLVEGGKTGAVSKNTNRTVDMGLMQINTIWLGEISKISGLSKPEVEEKLTNDACFNIFVSGYILKSEIDAADGKFWDGVGHYHSRTPPIKSRYISKVRKAWENIYGEPDFNP